MELMKNYSPGEINRGNMVRASTIEKRTVDDLADGPPGAAVAAVVLPAVAGQRGRQRGHHALVAAPHLPDVVLGDGLRRHRLACRLVPHPAEQLPTVGQVVAVLVHAARHPSHALLLHHADVRVRVRTLYWKTVAGNGNTRHHSVGTTSQIQSTYHLSDISVIIGSD